MEESFSGVDPEAPSFFLFREQTPPSNTPSRCFWSSFVDEGFFLKILFSMSKFFPTYPLVPRDPCAFFFGKLVSEIFSSGPPFIFPFAGRRTLNFSHALLGATRIPKRPSFCECLSRKALRFSSSFLRFKGRNPPRTPGRESVPKLSSHTFSMFSLIFPPFFLKCVFHPKGLSGLSFVSSFFASPFHSGLPHRHILPQLSPPCFLPLRLVARPLPPMACYISLFFLRFFKSFRFSFLQISQFFSIVRCALSFHLFG